MEAKKYVIEDSEPTTVCEPQVAYLVEQDDFDKEWECSMTLDEFYAYCMKRIDEIYG